MTNNEIIVKLNKLIACMKPGVKYNVVCAGRPQEWSVETINLWVGMLNDKTVGKGENARWLPVANDIYKQIRKCSL